MNRANPSDLRKALQTADTLAKAGLLFVCMPVRNAVDHANLVEQSQERLAQIARNLDKELPDE